jgi:hypothetical protein
VQRRRASGFGIERNCAADTTVLTGRDRHALLERALGVALIGKAELERPRPLRSEDFADEEQNRRLADLILPRG